jgi:hypothetical protein
VGNVARTGELRNTCSILVGKPERKRQPRRHRREDNIRMDLGEIVGEGLNWIDLAQDGDRWWDLVTTVMNLRVPFSCFSFSK